MRRLHQYYAPYQARWNAIPKQKRQWIVRSTIAVVALIIIWSGYSWYQQKRLAVEQSLVRPVPVMATLVEQRAMPILAQAFGDLRAFDIAQLSAQSSGNIEEINFNGGEKVAKDQVLITIENATQKANLQKAQAQLTLSQMEFDRAARLVKTGALPQQTLDQRRAELESSRADLASAQDAFDKTFTKAPFSGRLGARSISIGQYVSPAQNLVDLVNLTTLKVQYSVPEQYLSELRVGQETEITTSAYPDRIFKGKVDYVAPLVDPVTRSIAVEALVDNKEDLLSPGLSTQVSQVLAKMPKPSSYPKKA